MKDKDKIGRGDIFWAKNPYANGSVQFAYRPYLIISNDYCNEYSPTITAIPFTAKDNKTNIPTHYNLTIETKYNCALCEQITCINKCDIDSYIDTINNNDLKEIEKRVKIQLDLKGE